MRFSLKILVCAGALVSGVALPAFAREDCDQVVLPRTLDAVQTVVKDGSTVSAQAGLVDGYIKACPDHGWINALGGELDLMIYRGMRNANGGQPTQDGVNYLARAFARSEIFKTAPPETTTSRYQMPTSHSAFNNLDYSIASNSRSAIISELMTLALAGTVHPYLKPAEPLTCSGWLTSDMLTVAPTLNAAEEVVFLPFIDAAGEACRSEPHLLDRYPLALKSKAYARLVEQGAVTDPAEIERMLIAADTDAKAFLQNEGYRSLYYDEYDAKRLKTLLRKHGVHTGPGDAILPRSAWFTPDRIGSEAAIRSIVHSFDDYWTPVAAGDTDASSEEVAKARNQMSIYILRLKQEGIDAGFPEETSAMLTEALKAFHLREIVSPGRQGEGDMPPWLYDMIVKLLAHKPAPVAQ